MLRLGLPLAFLVATLALMTLSDRPLPRGDLVYADNQPVFSLDPQRVSFEHDMRLCYALYEGLTRWDTDTFEILPAAASSWTVSPDGRIYTFTIREEARWSNGDPVTASDFVFAWRRAMTPDVGAQYASLFFRIEGAEAYFTRRAERLGEYAARPASERTPDAARALHEAGVADFEESVGVRALDDRTLEVRLAAPTPYFLDLASFAPFLPVHPPTVEAWTTFDAASGAIRTDPGWTKPGRLVTNGPYELARWRFKRDLRLERSATFHDPSRARSAAIDRLVIEDGNTMTLAYETGAIDWATDVVVDYVGDMLEQQRDDIHAFPTFGVYFWHINCEPALPGGAPNPFADAAVRRAFTLAVDRVALVEHVRRRGEQPATTFVPPGAIPGFDEGRDIAGLAFDPDRARADLASAGWTDRDGDGAAENAAGEPFPVVELLCSTGSYHEQIAQALQEMWAEALGVRCRIVARESRTYRADLAGRNYMLARGGWFGDYGDPVTFLDLHRTGDGNNHRGFSDPIVDDLLARADREPDPRARMDLLEEAERYTTTEAVPLIPLWRYAQFYLFDPERVRGVSLHPRRVQYLGEIEVTP
jgi:oligopeptide transport system substrate-binding protein